MSLKRLSLVHYDVMRELCEQCRSERFHFVPIGASPEAGTCRSCGGEGRMADLSDTSIIRLITLPGGEMVVVPIIG